MKRRIFILTSALAFGVANASAEVSKPCELLDSLAEAAMLARQSGMPLIDIYKRVETAGADFAEAARPVIDLAYERPRQPTEETRKAAVTDFRDTVFKACMEDK